MLADRADEIIRNLFADVLISTDATAPYRLPLVGLSDRLWLRLDVILIVLVGRGWRITQHRHIRDIADEHRMRTEIYRLIDRYGNVGIGSRCNVLEAPSATCTAGEIRKLIDITTRLETEVLE